MSSVLEAMKGPIGVAFLTMVTVLVVSEDVIVRSLAYLDTHRRAAGPQRRSEEQ